MTATRCSTRGPAWLAGGLLALLATAASGEVNVQFSSGARHVRLLELYTSEGCSSCPPADRWLSGLADDPGLWRDFAPVAFHVDYWDYIGWQDRFAKAAWSERQRRLVADGAADYVYTPGVFSDGHEWHGWRTGGNAAPAPAAGGRLDVSVDDDTIRVRFAAGETAASGLAAHAALLGMNVTTEVRAGENRGRMLHHDFVALDLASAALARDGGDYVATMPRPASALADQALVVWVTSGDEPVPLQAAGTFLPAY